MRTGLQIRPLDPDRDAFRAAAVALAAFDRFVAPHYSEEGRRTFHKYASHDFLAYRLSRGETGFVAVLPAGEGAAETTGTRAGDLVVGMAVVRRSGALAATPQEDRGVHLSMLFVHPDCQGRGVGRALLDEVVRYAKQVAPGLVELTVNSSPNARGAYLRYGFVDAGPEVEDQGIRSLPMTLRV